MECILCEVIKLPSEFPPENVTEKCRHPPIACLRSSHASSHTLDSDSLVMEALCTMQYKENYIHVSTFAVINRDIHRSLWIINESWIFKSDHVT
ncbi:uncharacterized protein LOC128548049 isoform X2 [Mercenaria mercenaria]|uniref:uncharacterized protein LOC128548049 isoform X2 n=1 Tax=Mercenaria mercenaria TaxID=6596 RepID=UPI00234E76C0|nr:uncharacterized protein LOC128548049 isoform X2 [Mercenaria mercenaria]